jgi:hypothetical protein
VICEVLGYGDAVLIKLLATLAISAVGVFLIVAWVRRVFLVRREARRAIIQKLGPLGEKEYLIRGHHIRQAIKFLAVDGDFSVSYVAGTPGRWVHHPKYTGYNDANLDQAAAADNESESQFLEYLGEITQDTFVAHPEIREWVRWEAAVPETIVVK